MRLLETLAQPPVPLTRAQRLTLVAGTLVNAATRVLARGHSMWDWDEALFCLGVRDYNVVQHNPHPPGYPLFIAAAKLVRLAVHSDYLALQIVVMLCGAALLPLLVFFAREARFSFGAAFGGGLVFIFLPDVWIYSGTALSDVPSLALTLLACALLLRGCRSSGAYIAGAVVLALAAGIRPQALMVGIACGVIATVARWRVRRSAVVAAALLSAIVVAGCYAGAALASDPPGEYLHVVSLQSNYVSRVDSFHNPTRAPLRELAPLFFFRPVAANAVEIVAVLAAIGALLGIAMRRAPVLIALATFVPFAIFAWMMLDAAAVSRYAIGYLPLYALLAADALSLGGRLRDLVPQIACVILAAALAVWSWPAVKRVRAADAPPIAAIHWVLHNTYRGAGTLFVHASLSPYANYFLHGYDVLYFQNPTDLPASGYVEPAYVLTPYAVRSAGAHMFGWPHDRLWRIVRQRYFETAVLPEWDLVRFGAGWHDAEGEGESSWRWMARSSQATLPPAGPRARLAMHFFVPLDALPKPPTVEVTLNGALVERFVAAAPEIDKNWTLDARDRAANDLRIITSETVVPANAHPGADARELGLKVTALSWRPAR